MSITGVGRRISISGDVDPTATGDYALVVLASADHQHVGCVYPTKVLRVPLSDENVEPTMDEVKKAQAAAERAAFVAEPFCVPFEVWQKFVPKGGMGTVSKAYDMAPRKEPKPVLVTCEAGMNRSAWVAGMALVLTGEQETGKKAREYIQKLRGPEAFHNVHMRKLLDAYYPEELMRFRAKPVTNDPARGYVPGQ